MAAGARAGIYRGGKGRLVTGKAFRLGFRVVRKARVATPDEANIPADGKETVLQQGRRRESTAEQTPTGGGQRTRPVPVQCTSTAESVGAVVGCSSEGA